MKIIFTKLPKEGEIKVSFDGGSTYTDYNVSDVAESGIQLDDSQDLREIKIKSRTTVLSNLEVITGIKVEQANNTSNGNFTYDLLKEPYYPWCITNVTIPEGVTGICEQAFFNYISLTSITIPNSVTSIGRMAFYNCSHLESITIPEGVTDIGQNIFFGCSSLTSITIPNSVTTIDYNAFYGCTSLTSITIPDSVKSIGMWAFKNCSSLTTINYTGTEEQWNAISKDKSWNDGSPSNLVINYNYQG